MNNNNDLKENNEQCHHDHNNHLIRRKKRHVSSTYITKQSTIQISVLSICILLLSILSNNKLKFGVQHNSNNNEEEYHKRHRNLKNQKKNTLVGLTKLNNDDDNMEEMAESISILPKNNDFKKYSCSDIFTYISSYAISEVDNPTINMINKIQCQYAETCNNHEGIFLSTFFCPTEGENNNNEGTNLQKKAFIYVPILLLILLLLFRIVSSTAEDYFSPSLEMFSIQLGLPSRFAGVTLLALGNGAPDIAATVSAMLQDKHDGYLMSIGELIGAAMFASTIIVSIILFIYSDNNSSTVVKDYYPCTGGLLREVLVFMFTILLIWYQFHIVQRIDYSFIYLCLIIYASYVAIVFTADVFHKKVYLPKLLQRHQQNDCDDDECCSYKREEKTLLYNNNCNTECCKDESIEATLLLRTHNHTSADISKRSTGCSNSVKKIVENFVEAISNYSDPTSSWTMISSMHSPAVTVPITKPTVTNAISEGSYQNGGLKLLTSSNNNDTCCADKPCSNNSATTTPDTSKEPLVVVHLHHGGVQSLDYASLQHHHSNPSLPLHHNHHYCNDHLDPCVESSSSLSSSTTKKQSIISIIKYDMLHVLYEIKHDVFECKHNTILDVIFLTIEIPITILRIITVPLPCPGYYNRTIVGLSLIVSTIWLQFYFNDQFDIDYFRIGLPYYPYVTVIIPTCFACYIWYYGNDINTLNVYVIIIIAIYGFAIAATWIDYLADNLVNVLGFFGILYHIPGSIMGLTVLAWGNAFADMSANMIIARKGLSEMAMTCCFAGPVFNILIGLGIGFFFLLSSKNNNHKNVNLTLSLDVGLCACIINCIFIIICSMYWRTSGGGGKIPVKYGYVACFIFVAYTIGALIAMAWS